MNESEPDDQTNNREKKLPGSNPGKALPSSRNINPDGTDEIEKASGAPKPAEIIIFSSVILAFIVLLSWRSCRAFLDAHAGSVTAIATIAIVILTAFYVIYARSQWEAMEGQLRQMASSAAQTERLIIEATKSADAATQSADAVVNMERAWFFETLDPKPFPELREHRGLTGRYGCYWSIKNYGRTPGWIVEIDGGFEKVKTLDDIRTTPHRPEVFAGKFFVLVPGADTPVFTASGTIASDRGLLEEGFLCCAYGIIKYKDAFGDEIHETGFCYIYDREERKFVKSDRPAYYNKHT